MKQNRIKIINILFLVGVFLSSCQTQKPTKISDKANIFNVDNPARGDTSSGSATEDVFLRCTEETTLVEIYDFFLVNERSVELEPTHQSITSCLSTHFSDQIEDVLNMIRSIKLVRAELISLLSDSPSTSSPSEPSSASSLQPESSLSASPGWSELQPVLGQSPRGGLNSPTSDDSDKLMFLEMLLIYIDNPDSDDPNSDSPSEPPSPISGLTLEKQQTLFSDLDFIKAVVKRKPSLIRYFKSHDNFRKIIIAAFKGTVEDRALTLWDQLPQDMKETDQEIVSLFLENSNQVALNCLAQSSGEGCQGPSDVLEKISDLLHRDLYNYEDRLRDEILDTSQKKVISAHGMSDFDSFFLVPKGVTIVFLTPFSFLNIGHKLSPGKTLSGYNDYKKYLKYMEYFRLTHPYTEGQIVPDLGLQFKGVYTAQVTADSPTRVPIGFFLDGIYDLRFYNTLPQEMEDSDVKTKLTSGIQNNTLSPVKIKEITRKLKTMEKNELTFEPDDSKLYTLSQVIREHWKKVKDEHKSAEPPPTTYFVTACRECQKETIQGKLRECGENLRGTPLEAMLEKWLGDEEDSRQVESIRRTRTLSEASRYMLYLKQRIKSFRALPKETQGKIIKSDPKRLKKIGQISKASNKLLSNNLHSISFRGLCLLFKYINEVYPTQPQTEGD